MQLLLAYSAEFESLIFLPEGSPKMKIQNVKTIVMQKLNLLVSFVLILKQKWIFEKIHTGWPGNDVPPGSPQEAPIWGLMGGFLKK